MRQERRTPAALLWLLAILAIPGIHIATALLSQEGPARIERVLRAEYGALGLRHDDVRTRQYLDSMIQGGYRIAWQESGLEEAAAGDGQGFIARMLAGAWPGIEAWILAAELIALRLGVLTLALPFYLLVLLLAFLDGLVGWFIRRTVAGRESAFIYHRTKHLFFSMNWLAVFAYLAAPIPLDPLYVFPPWYFASALLLRFTVHYFKKYL